MSNIVKVYSINFMLYVNLFSAVQLHRNRNGIEIETL